jgi:NAD-dependent SIR2 family protein deacetylase
MRRKVLKVIEDFYQKDFNVGDIISFIEGKVRILEKDYHNSFGTFILCEYLDYEEELDEGNWERMRGAIATPENVYEIVGSIHVPGYRNLLGGIGFFLKDRRVNEVTGYTYRQTWNLLFHHGAVNAEASKSTYKLFHSHLIDSIDGLPSLDSCYWKIPAYNEQGLAFSPFTDEALHEIKKAMGDAVRNRIRECQKQKFETDFSAINPVVDLIKQSKRIVVLAGAGLSTASGIPDYRSTAEGLWLKNPTLINHLNQVAFEKNPSQTWQSFYYLLEQSLSNIVPFSTKDALFAALNAIEPNEGHRFFAWLSKELGKNVTVIGQNVDGLERKAGIQKVIQMHGNIHECICLDCQKMYPLSQVLVKYQTPSCECGSVLRPNVVFFGDSVKEYEKAQKVVSEADLVLVVGTSLEVYPFNQLPAFRGEQSKIVLLNGSSVESEFDYVLKGDIRSICSHLKQHLLR